MADFFSKFDQNPKPTGWRNAINPKHNKYTHAHTPHTKAHNNKTVKKSVIKRASYMQPKKQNLIHRGTNKQILIRNYPSQKTVELYFLKGQNNP